MRTNPTDQQETFEDVLARRLARRDFLKGAASAASMLVLSEAIGGSTAAHAHGRTTHRSLTFNPIELSTEDRVVVPEGYVAKTVVRWGDPIFPGAPAFNVNNQSAVAQRRQLGYNCDFLNFFELPATRSTSHF